jgi:NADH-quinone oxidoreductase subunit J
MDVLTADDILFHLFAAIATISALAVVFVGSPIYSALFLALTMSVLGVLFFMLNAAFVAVAQVTVYAGAVMVLFVMVLMLFDLKKEHEDIIKVSPVSLAKVLGVCLLAGFLMGVGWLAIAANQSNPATVAAPALTMKDLEKTPLPPGHPAVAGESPPADQIAGAPAAGVVNPDDDLTAAEAAKLVESGAALGTTVPSADGKAEIKIDPEKSQEFGSTESLSRRLFSKYVFAFEAVSLLLLVAIVGAVALAKSKGGTHHVAR